MALPALLLGALRTAAISGRSYAAAGARRAGMRSLMNALQPRPAPNSLAAGLFPASQQEFGDAARHFGTPNPNAQQLARFAAARSASPAAGMATAIPSSSGPSTPPSGADRLADYVDASVKVAKFGAATALATASLRDWTAGVVSHAERLRDFSPQIGEASARSQIADLRRTWQEATATGGTTAALLQARSNRLDAKQPLDNAMQNLSNTVQVGITRAQDRFYQWLDKVGVDDAIKYVTKGVAAILNYFGIIVQIEENRRPEDFQKPFKDWLKRIEQQPETPLPSDFAGGRGGRFGR